MRTSMTVLAAAEPFRDLKPGQPVLLSTNWPRAFPPCEWLYVADADELPEGYVDELTQPGDILLVLTPDPYGDPCPDGTTAGLRFVSARWVAAGTQQLTIMPAELEV